MRSHRLQRRPEPVVQHCHNKPLRYGRNEASPRRVTRTQSKGQKPWRYDYTIHGRVRVRFIVGMSPPDDLDFLSQAELKGLVVKQWEQMVELQRTVAALRDEIARLKGGPPRPKLRPSGMERGTEPKPPGSSGERKHRRGSTRSKLSIDEERTVKVAAPPRGSRFKGYTSFVVQDLLFRPHVVNFRCERWQTPDGGLMTASLPAGIDGHFGPELRRFVLAQYHQGQMTVPRLVTLLRGLGILISKRQVMRLLIDSQDGFLTEARDVLRAGLSSAAWITVDDTGARHKAANGFCTQIGNAHFTWFGTTPSKSRLNFLELLRAGHDDYVINDAALAYMRARALASHVIARLIEHPDRHFADRTAWSAHLERLGISALRVNPDPVMVATEGALWGSVKAHGFLPNAVIVSDDAGQFNIGRHGLCWVHTERLIHKPPCRPGARPRPDLEPLSRSQSLSARSQQTAQGRTPGAVRPHLHPQDRLCHPRPSSCPSQGQQARIADGTRPSGNPAAHQRIGERHPLPCHQA